MIANAQVRGSRTDTGTVGSQILQPTKSAPNSNKINPKDTSGLFIFFILAFLAWIAVSAALVYHWRKYAKGDSKVALAQIIYFAVSLLLLAIAIISIS